MVDQVSMMMITVKLGPVDRGVSLFLYKFRVIIILLSRCSTPPTTEDELICHVERRGSMLILSHKELSVLLGSLTFVVRANNLFQKKTH
jgi:hypothetical protein